jgi:hypothetical protein
MTIGIRRAGNKRAGKVNRGNEAGIKAKGISPTIGRVISTTSFAYPGLKLLR